MPDNHQPMASAPMTYDAAGEVDWGAMWGDFCALASRGGPPHRGTMLRPGAAGDPRGAAYRAAEAEIARGIRLAAGLDARPHAPGWLAAPCDSAAMAAWLAGQGCLEGVSMRAEGALLLVPCGEDFRLEAEIKNVITAVAKPCHYWRAHRLDPQQRRAAALERLGRDGHGLSRRAFLRCSAAGLGGLLLAACGEPPADARGGASSGQAAAPGNSGAAPASVPGFAGFAERVAVRADDEFLYVESDGLPDHPMMIGIRSWQQQVPLPQPYVGANAWRIPRQGVLSDAPVSARTGLFRGAIALAVNGVPIFNALNNRGEDAYLAGELDEWGGHAGRADDYHYHVAPLHLQAAAGPGQPIAYALDGFPIYGLAEPDGAPATGLDAFSGHEDAERGYHYHATESYPYINGGLRGVVAVRDDQVEPQPRAAPVRPGLSPLRGAVVSGFARAGADAFELEYQLDGGTHRISCQGAGGRYTFTFTDPAGRTRTETYARAAVRSAASARAAG